MKVIIAEKPSVARDIAAIVGAPSKKRGGYILYASYSFRFSWT